MMLRITSNRFVAGAVTRDAKVSYAAPIIGYMQGWAVEKVKTYCKMKGWTFELVSSN